MLPAIDVAEEWKLPAVQKAVAAHLLDGMTLDVSRQELEEDVCGALTRSQLIGFEWVSSSRTDCELLGMYTPTPPRIRVKRDQGTARANFTAAHELGHHLQESDPDWALDVLASLRSTHPHLMAVVEERVSDHVASQVLMPDAVVNAAWSGRLTPAFVKTLTRNGFVSRQAASIRAHAHAIDDANAVIIVATGDGLVTSAIASPHSTLSRPASGTVQPDIAQLVQGNEGHARAGVGLLYRSGATRSDIAYEWCWDHNGTHLLVVARPEYRFGHANWDNDAMACDACEQAFYRTSAVLCRSCMKPRCPSCNTCGCERRVGGFCSKCFMQLSLAESAAGAHDECPI